MWDRAILCIYLIASISHRLYQKEAWIGLVNVVALIHLDGDEGKHRQAVEEGGRLVEVKMASSEAAWHSHLYYCVEADPSPHLRVPSLGRFRHSQAIVGSLSLAGKCWADCLETTVPTAARGASTLEAVDQRNPLLTLDCNSSL